MSEFKIEKDVPVKEASNRASKYPFKDMEVGDSFFVDDASLRGPIQNACRAYGARNFSKFVTRTVSNGFRVWRIV